MISALEEIRESNSIKTGMQRESMCIVRKGPSAEAMLEPGPGGRGEPALRGSRIRALSQWPEPVGKADMKASRWERAWSAVQIA